MGKAKIEKILSEFSATPITYDVYIIANTQEKSYTSQADRVIHASKDEFFSRREFAEISSAIFDVFGYVRVFYSELEFLNYALMNNIQRDECLVYNLARDGIHSGKKSLIPAVCDLLGLTYTGSDAFVISLLRNKFVYTNFLKQFGISVPPSWLLLADGSFPEGGPDCGTRIIVKNLQESASIGLSSQNVFTYHNNAESLDKLTACCKRMQCEHAIVQKFISGMECEIFVIECGKGNYTALDPVLVQIHHSEIINSEISNSYDYSFDLLEHHVSAAICKMLCKTAEKCAALLGIETYARFDFRIDTAQNFYLIDIAGTPYTIQHSSIAYLFQEVYGLHYKDIYKVIGYLAKQKNT